MVSLTTATSAKIAKTVAPSAVGGFIALLLSDSGGGVPLVVAIVLVVVATSFGLLAKWGGMKVGDVDSRRTFLFQVGAVCVAALTISFKFGDQLVDRVMLGLGCGLAGGLILELIESRAKRLMGIAIARDQESRFRQGPQIEQSAIDLKIDERMRERDADPFGRPHDDGKGKT